MTVDMLKDGKVSDDEAKIKMRELVDNTLALASKLD
jgi:hypothetical protein